jgi:hypothetical protein
VLTRMLDGVDPPVVSEIRHAAEHVPGVAKLLDVKARWLGHKLHADVAILVDGAQSVIEADKIGAALKREMLAHIPTLSVANIRCHGGEPLSVPAEKDHGGEHHHAPEPFKVASPLATGLLEIVDTPHGERMRLTLDRPAHGLDATVTIDREGGKVETLPLVRVVGKVKIFESVTAPAEPHEFAAQLRLQIDDRQDILPFAMAEPAGHVH